MAINAMWHELRALHAAVAKAAYIRIDFVKQVEHLKNSLRLLLQDPSQSPTAANIRDARKQLFIEGSKQE